MGSGRGRDGVETENTGRDGELEGIWGVVRKPSAVETS